jgi:hypothetical protein
MRLMRLLRVPCATVAAVQALLRSLLRSLTVLHLQRRGR